MRETGGDILWDDAGWYVKWGSWSGPDWRLTTEFLAKHNMKWALWFPTYFATPDSKVGQHHPDWLIPGGDVFEQSIKITADWQRQMLDKSVEDWGDYQWRFDGPEGPVPPTRRTLTLTKTFVVSRKVSRKPTSHAASTPVQGAVVGSAMIWRAWPTREN